MSSLSILFKAQSRVSHSFPLRNITFSLDCSFGIFSPASCTENMISHGRRVALIPFSVSTLFLQILTYVRDAHSTWTNTPNLVDRFGRSVIITLLKAADWMPYAFLSPLLLFCSFVIHLQPTYLTHRGVGEIMKPPLTTCPLPYKQRIRRL